MSPKSEGAGGVSPPDNRKDGTGISVVVEHEIALQPGVAIMQRYFDPKKDTGIRMEGELRPIAAGRSRVSREKKE